MAQAFLIKSARSGQADFEDKGQEGAFKHGWGLDIRKRVDSLSCNQDLMEIGELADSFSPSSSVSPSASISRSASPSVSRSASPTPSPSASASPSVSVSLSGSATPSFSGSPSPSPSMGQTSVFKDLVIKWVACTDGYTYGFGNSGYVYRVTDDLSVQQVYHDADGEITGAEEKPSNQHKTYLVFCTRTKVKRKEIPGRADWNDVTTIDSNLENTTDHFAVQSGGALYIANRSFLALYGYDNSYTNEALDLIPGNLARTLVERKGRVNIGTYPQGNPEKGTNAAVDCEFPLAQIGNEGEVYFSNMVDAVPYKKFPGGGQVKAGGACNEIDQSGFFDWDGSALSWIDKQTVRNISYWGVYNAEVGYGGIYSIGRKNKNHPFAMNLEHKLDVDVIGAVIVKNGIKIISYQDGSEFGAKATDVNTKCEAAYFSLDFKEPTKNPEKITQWLKVDVPMKPLPTGCWIECWYRKDKTSDFVQAYVGDSATQKNYDTALSKNAVFRIGTDASIFEVKFILHPFGNTCPEIYFPIKIFFM